MQYLVNCATQYTTCCKQQYICNIFCKLCNMYFPQIVVKWYNEVFRIYCSVYNMWYIALRSLQGIAQFTTNLKDSLINNNSKEHFERAILLLKPRNWHSKAQKSLVCISSSLICCQNLFAQCVSSRYLFGPSCL